MAPSWETKDNTKLRKQCFDWHGRDMGRYQGVTILTSLQAYSQISTLLQQGECERAKALRRQALEG